MPRRSDRKSTNRLRHLREGSRLDLREVARQLELDPGLLSRYERGIVEISDDRKQMFADFYGCSRAHVMGWDEPPLLGRRPNGDGDDEDRRAA